MGAQAVRLSNGDIDDALKDKDFEVLFQPIFDLGNGALARVESFIRWRHASLGVLPPGAFISFFETQGRMSELTRYVLAEALSAYQAWRGPHAPGFSINLAMSDLSDDTFASHFTRLLRESGFPPEFVTLECPMPAVDADLETTTRQLQRLSETGARLAIEVRGRANDFLKTVRPFPFAEIKTGGAAILRFARTVRGPGLSAISELLELAAEQNAAITAVGVEDQASLSALRGLGFAAAQGNHLAKVGALGLFMPSHVNDVRALLGLDPLSSDDLAALFRTGAPRLAEAPADAETAPTTADADNEALLEEVAEAAAADDVQSGDGLVQRLAARIAQSDTKSAASAAEDERRAAAKAAAIARAKRKKALQGGQDARNALKDKAAARADAPAPRDMQERLSREFGEPAANIPTTDDFDLDDAPSPADAAVAAPAEAEIAAAASPPEAEDASVAPPAVAPPAAPKPFDARMAVKGARAHFSPTCRVASPEAVDLDEPVRPAAPRRAAAPAPEPEPVEEIDDAIPEPMASAAWLEETVKVETGDEADDGTDDGTQAAAPKRSKTFLSRTVIPFSALKITHFWPRYIRKRMKRDAGARAAQ
ncbi:MAG: hypothetical protein A3E78_11430 [Alphaproteobacteria bacterium RIFCSPHIGHO2_12_FULL_63_12]|nr:MAG: hypothetical protein A3E78_11430 [Alphaproteobacteria bacterium RIFCSPHIGHO2_12_FULL_63_12]